MNERDVRQTQQPGTEPLCGTSIGLGPGQVPEERLEVLHLRGVEESEPFVNVRANPASLDRFFEELMPRSSAKQNGDVVGSNRPGRPQAVPDHFVGQEPFDLRGDRRGTLPHARLTHQTKHRQAVATSPWTDVADREPIRVVVAEPFWQIRRSLHSLSHGVDEGEQFRHGTIAR